jgi:hypothetical protein
MVVQPIDVCGTSGLSTCAPFNTTSTNGVGNPTTACNPSGSNPLNCGNPIGFVVNPTTGVANPTSGGVDVTRALLNQIGVDLTSRPIATYNSPTNPNTNTTFQTLNVTQTTNSAGATVFDSTDFKTLSYQPQISQGATITSPNTVFPNAPLGVPLNGINIVNLVFVNTLVPPTQQSGGTLYGLGWIGNNGVAISQNTFGYPRSRTSPPPRPDTIAHELLHNLGLDHTTFAAGPWTPPPSGGVYLAPTGVAPPIPANPLVSECDPSYPACGANLMTTGSLRTEPTLGCVLGANPPANPCVTTVSGVTVPLPTLMNGMADQVTPLPSAFYPKVSSTQLPVSQQTQVLSGGSGLLFPESTLGFLNPIPHETTQAQVDTGGSTASIVFDLSGPTSGGPGETLVAWILTLSDGQTFARHNRFHVVSQSRRDVVQDVNYYPDADHPLMKDIAFDPDANDNPDNPGARPTPCAAQSAECLLVKFQPPGLGAQDHLSFSKSILTSGAPITNDDLCKAKITYIFSDGYATTSDLGPCPAGSLPLISSSWRPDPTVPPRIVHINVLLAQTTTSPPCTPDPVTGQCPPLTLADANPSEEGGQPGQSCSSGPINGTINGNVIVPAGQNCVFNNPCEIKGNMTINGGSVYLNCALDGSLTENSGRLVLGPAANIGGNVLISQASSFTLGATGPVIPGALIRGNLTIQNLPASLPDRGTVCATRVNGYLLAQNNASQIEIGGSGCGNTVAGNLQVNNNTGQTDVSDNTVIDNLQCQGNTGHLTGAANVVNGSAQGQCTMFVQ